MQVNTFYPYNFYFQRNVYLTKLDVSWNGLGQEGCFWLGKMLMTNSCLLLLDVSSNRITIKGLGYLLDGLSSNDCLETLRVSVFYSYYPSKDFQTNHYNTNRYQ